MDLTDFIEKIPKAELHVHLEGSIAPATLLTLAERNKISLPFSTPDQMKSLFNYRTFKDFAQLFLLFVHCLRKPEDFTYAVLQHGAEMARQNIRYAEITWTPQLYLHRDHTLDDILDALNAGRMGAKEKWNIEMRWIPDMVRSVPGPMQTVLPWACKPETRRRGVVALGLGGPEKNIPSHLFKDIFSQAHEKGLPVNPHAGENEGPQSVWGAIRELKATRIGHGVRSVEDNDLLLYLKKHAIPLEICPTSNLRLKVYPSYAEHPLKKLIEAGCAVTINTDDPVLFQTTLTQEYLHAVKDCGLTVEELTECVLNAVSASYLEDQGKNDMLAAFQTEISSLQLALKPIENNEKMEMNQGNPTDFNRWVDESDGWGVNNPQRSKIAGDLIPNGSSVLDLGAGSMILKKYLKPDCHYQPCDVHARSAECLVADLNKKQFPQGKFDWVVMLGVFQFLTDPAWAVEQCRKVADNAIFSYSPTINKIPTPEEIQWREGEGWLNHFNRRQYFSIIRDAGWEIKNVFRVPGNFVVACHAEERTAG